MLLISLLIGWLCAVGDNRRGPGFCDCKGFHVRRSTETVLAKREPGEGGGRGGGGVATPKVFTRMCGLGFQQPNHCGAC